MESIKSRVDKAIEDGVLTTAEHEELMELIHKDGKLDTEEREQLGRISRLTQSGELKIVDEDREASYERRREDLKKKLLEKAKSNPS